MPALVAVLNQSNELSTFDSGTTQPEYHTPESDDGVQIDPIQ